MQYIITICDCLLHVLLIVFKEIPINKFCIGGEQRMENHFERHLEVHYDVIMTAFICMHSEA